MIIKEYTIVTTKKEPGDGISYSIRDESGVEIARSSKFWSYDFHFTARLAAKRWLKRNTTPVDQRPAKVKKSKYIMKFEDK